MSGATAQTRWVIVNADDFGRSTPINRGIIHAHENGIVTSASLMVRWPAAAEAAAYARRRTGLSLGLHLDLGEMVFRDDVWVQTYEVVDLEDEEAIAAEAREQLASFRELAGRNPTHLDSHQHVHRKSSAADAVASQLASALEVPLRQASGHAHYVGHFYGQTTEGYSLPQSVSTEALDDILRSLPAGVSEIGCHPGDGSDPHDTYNRERRLELHTLCDPSVRRGVPPHASLCSFADGPLVSSAFPGCRPAHSR